MQDTKNRQNSLETDDQAQIEWWKWAQEEVIETVQDLYTQALRRGIAKEVARALLPEGLTKSKIYMQGTIRSFIHFCEVRTGEETQKEHRMVAQGVAAEIARIFPIIGECGGN